MRGRRITRRVLLAGAIVLLTALSWGTISGGIRQVPRSHNLGQWVETTVQLGCGLLSVLAVLTCFRGRRWGMPVLTAWAVALAITAGLSALVWGPPSPLVALVFAAAALLIALGIRALVRDGVRGSAAGPPG